MRRSYTYLLAMVLGVLSFSSCRKEPASPDGDKERIPVRWTVTEVEAMEGTKALVNDLEDLQTACNTGGKSIGVWADYSIVEQAAEATTNGELVVYENVFDNAAITYDGTGWTAMGNEIYWAVGGDYKFRAYYPQTLVDHIMETSDADVFVVDYNTSLLQEDMMVAYNTTDTQSADLTEPVELSLTHTLSAVRLRFQFIDGYVEEDYLTSCWLENTSDEGLTTIGMMVYGGENPEQVSWSESYQPPVGQKIYYWEHPGLNFKRTSSDNTYATAYTDGGSSTAGNKFTENEGWILIIPQESGGDVNICFTTNTGGDVIYRVAIPKKTGTTIDGETNGTDEELVHYVPGRRYTYTVNIGKTNLELLISLSKWNQLDSSYTITF